MSDIPLHAGDSGASERVMSMLQAGVPISLLVDLFHPDALPSREVLQAESLPSEPWWLPRPHGGPVGSTDQATA